MKKFLTFIVGFVLLICQISNSQNSKPFFNTGTWLQGANCPVYTDAGTSVAYQKNDSCWIYLLGGMANPSVHRYNVNTNTWITLALLPNQRIDAFSAIIMDSIYYMGGYNGSFYENTVYKYDIISNTWSQKNSLPYAISSGGAVTYQDSLVYVIGGYNISQTYSSVILFNVYSDNWRFATNLPQPRRGGAVARTGDTIVYIGGCHSGINATSTTYIGIINQNDKSQIIWTTGTNYPGGVRWDFSAVNYGLNNGIFVAAGSTTGIQFNTTNDAYQYYPGVDSWIQKSNKITPVCRATSSAAYIGNNIWKLTYIAGRNPSNRLNVTEYFQDTISQTPSQPQLISPTNGSTNISLTPTLYWNTVSNTIAYKVEVSPISNFSYIMDSATVTTNQRTIPPGILNVATNYFWRVRGLNSFGNGPWSVVWSFSTLLTGIQKTSSEIPTEYILYANFPNPFNPTTNIKFDVPKSSFIKITIYDVLGRLITSLVNEKLNAGSYEVDWNASNLASGIYFYRMIAGDFVAVKKMIVIK